MIQLQALDFPLPSVSFCIQMMLPLRCCLQLASTWPYLSLDILPPSAVIWLLTSVELSFYTVFSLSIHGPFIFSSWSIFVFVLSYMQSSPCSSHRFPNSFQCYALSILSQHLRFFYLPQKLLPESANSRQERRKAQRSSMNLSLLYYCYYLVNSLRLFFFTHNPQLNLIGLTLKTISCSQKRYYEERKKKIERNDNRNERPPLKFDFWYSFTEIHGRFLFAASIKWQ